MSCNHEWDDYPGTHAQIRPIKREGYLGIWYEPGCPKCGGDYWKWLNYEDICNRGSG